MNNYKKTEIGSLAQLLDLYRDDFQEFQEVSILYKWDVDNAVYIIGLGRLLEFAQEFAIDLSDQSRFYGDELSRELVQAFIFEQLEQE